jgi:hypothetical protein
MIDFLLLGLYSSIRKWIFKVHFQHQTQNSTGIKTKGCNIGKLIVEKIETVISIDAKHLEESDNGTFFSQYRFLSGVPLMPFENKILASTAVQNHFF